MLRYVAQRLLLAVPVALTVASVIFLVIRVLPGDPAQAALGENASRAAVDSLRTRLGLDAPLPLQYVRFLTDLLHADLGRSMITGASVSQQLAYNLPFTLELTTAAIGVGLTLGVPLGVYASVRRDRGPDVVARIVSLLGLCLPAFFLGILAMLLFGVRLGWLPTIGGGDPQSVGDLVAHLALPAFTLGLVMIASVVRITRAAMLNVLLEDYVRTARAKGIRERAIIRLHALRPALLPIVSLTGVWAVALIGDSVTTEVVFSRPGLGKMMVGAILQRDYSSLQSVMLVYALIVIAINLVADVSYGFVDPRIRR